MTCKYSVELRFAFNKYQSLLFYIQRHLWHTIRTYTEFFTAIVTTA